MVTTPDETPMDDDTTDDDVADTPTEGSLKEIISNFKPSADFSITFSYNSLMISHDPVSLNPKLGEFVSALREAITQKNWYINQWNSTQFSIQDIPGNYSTDDINKLIQAVIDAAKNQFELTGVVKDMAEPPIVDMLPNNVLVGKAYLSPQQKVIQQVSR